MRSCYSFSSVNLGRGEVHVWTIPLDVTSPGLWTLLSEDERQRASRFVFESHRGRFVSARANMRKILARYLGIPPQAICFVYGPYGKPSLANRLHPIFFNFSHSAGVGLLAVGTEFELGIDLEQIRKDIEAVEIAKCFFSEAEFKDLAMVAPELRYHAFYNCWTRKEAILKGIGAGLNLRLDGFDVSCVPGVAAQLIGSRVPQIDMALWSLFSIDLGTDFAAALAVAAGDVSIKVTGVEGEFEPTDEYESRHAMKQIRLRGLSS